MAQRLSVKERRDGADDPSTATPGKEARNPPSKLRNWRINREITDMKTGRKKNPVLPNNYANAVPLWELPIVLRRGFARALSDVEPVSVKVRPRSSRGKSETPPVLYALTTPATQHGGVRVTGRIRALWILPQ